MQGMYRPTSLVQGATNSASAFVRLFQKILNAQLGSITEIFTDHVTAKGSKSQYAQDAADGPPEV
jgi:hypothetical protein